ncbi:MAG TPA: TolC family protein [Puia sp.]|nr:TolC family protein [Puia sp.]
MALKKLRLFRDVFVVRILLITGLIFSFLRPEAQNLSPSDSLQSLTLGQCIDYAFKHQPVLFQAYINQSITKANNAINLSGWWPQVNIGGNFTHYNSLPTSFITDSTTGQPVKQHTGVVNTAVPALTVSQAIFSPSLIYASKAANFYVQQSEQVTDSAKIDLVASVSKAFYSLLLTIEQITVLREDTARLTKNLNDAYHQYVGGIVDMTDYQEAAISLNNSRSQLKQAVENVIPQYASLKQLMGWPPQTRFNVNFDTTEMKQDIQFDTTQELVYEKRIEYQILQTNKTLQHQVTDYYKLSFLPTISGFFNYDFQYENNNLAALYANVYPYSFVGLSINLPIFTGFYRTKNIQKSKLQEQLLDWSQISLKSEIYTEYTTALANYKSNLYNLYTMQDNVAMAKNVYDIVTLQYQQGVVAYLNVITAESNLITSQIGYLNALFQVLSNKVDLQKSMGIIYYNH